MKKRFLFVSLVILFAFSLVACNMPTKDDGDMPSLEEQAGTLVAQTLTAAAVEEIPTETPVPPLSTPTKPQPTVTPAPTLTPTATVQLSAPKKPSLDNYNFTCAWNGTNLDLNVTMQWVDYAENEQGYYIYRNAQQVADLAPNSGNYIDLYAVENGVSVNYAIEAYNSLGRSEKLTFSVSCQ